MCEGCRGWPSLCCILWLIYSRFSTEIPLYCHDQVTSQCQLNLFTLNQTKPVKCRASVCDFWLACWCSRIRGVTYNAAGSASFQPHWLSFLHRRQSGSVTTSAPSLVSGTTPSPFCVCSLYTERQGGIKVQHSSLVQAE